MSRKMINQFPNIVMLWSSGWQWVASLPDIFTIRSKSTSRSGPQIRAPTGKGAITHKHFFYVKKVHTSFIYFFHVITYTGSSLSFCGGTISSLLE